MVRVSGLEALGSAPVNFGPLFFRQRRCAGVLGNDLEEDINDLLTPIRREFIKRLDGPFKLAHKKCYHTVTGVSLGFRSQPPLASRRELCRAPLRRRTKAGISRDPAAG